ncbi:MAG: BadF/BadG/BcrA/BcrD ATPase family protein, partial [Thermoanaerobacterium sp.]|nr:BadF/BadG/BcrA/BcrD ATPase family protein [Thermoanaerobacterium sp.]
MFFLGVDGGGTKTKFVLINERLEVCSVVETTTTHIFQVGEKGIIDVLKKGLGDIISKTNINKQDIEYVVLGMPGYTEIKSNDSDIEKAVGEVFSFTKYYIANDAEISWAGALACKPGISIVAGTGSIGFAVDPQGNKVRTGGWGDFIGDEGSAHWIARKVLEMYSKQKDGRLPPSVLVDIIEREYHIKDEYELIDIIHNRYKLDRRKIARFSLCAFNAAQHGCQYSKVIFEKAAFELYLHIEALLKKTSFPDRVLVSYTGGLFKAGDFILKPFKELLEGLNDKIDLITPYMEPAFGAAFYAYLISRKKEPTEEL